MYEPKVNGAANNLLNEAISLFLISTSPLVSLFYFIAYQDFDASVVAGVQALISEGPVHFFATRCPHLSASSVLAYAAWVLSQAILYHYLPGQLHQAPRTIGGRQLLYRLNGLLAWAVTVAIAAAASYYGLVDPTFIARHWGSLLATANVYCVALIAVFYVKARVSPDNVGETLLTGKTPIYHHTGLFSRVTE